MTGYFEKEIVEHFSPLRYKSYKFCFWMIGNFEKEIVGHFSPSPTLSTVKSVLLDFLDDLNVIIKIKIKVDN